MSSPLFDLTGLNHAELALVSMLVEYSVGRAPSFVTGEWIEHANALVDGGVLISIENLVEKGFLVWDDANNRGDMTKKCRVLGGLINTMKVVVGD